MGITHHRPRNGVRVCRPLAGSISEIARLQRPSRSTSKPDRPTDGVKASCGTLLSCFSDGCSLP